MALTNLASIVRKIQIVKNDITFDVHPWQGFVANPLEELKIIQDINSTTIGGHLIIKDAFNWSGDLSITGTEKLIVELFSDISYSTTKTIEFKIFSIQQITNTGTNVSMNQFEYFNAIKIDFSTDNILSENSEYDLFNLGDDFVGYIATDGSGNIPGLINEIFNKFGFEEYEIEPSYNGVWIRSNELTYPWAKSKGQTSLERLLKYVTSYTVSKDNKNAINYFLWRDIDGYHFKSVEKMIADSAEIKNFYVFTNETTYPFAIKTVYEMSEANILELSDNNVFQSFYEKITPNYDEYYLDFVDNNLSFKRETIDFNYHRDFETWTPIETNKILPDSTTTSVYSSNGKNILQSLRTDDTVYGYYSDSKLNTPFPQKWDHIGKTGDSRWNDIVFIPQYDMTELDIQTFYTIHKKIREPLKAKRAKYSYLKNLKRKWEVYRCSICCLSDRLGGIQDELDIARIRGVTNPQENTEFKLLFGPTGIFGDLGVNYKVAAAGSFSDVYNYDSDTTNNKGLSLSYDLNSAPFNETIADFYHLNSDFSNYEKHIFTNGFKEYDDLIGKYNKQLIIVNEFLEKADEYISAAAEFQTENFLDYDFNDIKLYSNGAKSFLNILLKPPEGKYQRYLYAGSALIDELGRFKLSEVIFDCSKQKIFDTGIVGVEEYIRDYDENGEPVFGYSAAILDFFRTYDYLMEYTDNEFNFKDSFRENSYNNFLSLVNNKKAFCFSCLNNLGLEILKRTSQKRKVFLEQQIKLITFFKNTISEKLYEKWKTSKEEYLNRKAFFISKEERKIKNADNEIVASNLSLFNIKSIKRKPVRGSRYEILARTNGITGNQTGEYLYKIFFDDEEVDISEDGNHPYYDQKYKQENTFLGSDIPTRLKFKDEIFKSNDPPLGQYSPDSLPKLGGYFEARNSNIVNNQNTTDLGYGNRMLESISTLYSADLSNYENKFNIFKSDIIDKKPPNLKREEISSYIRIEFKQPIGVESLSDFPNGFVRNAGYEYFLPYIVSLTAGPNGRQTINQNVVVIGMDPYGFDVAMKKIPDPQYNGEYYWWSSGIQSSQMDLWPEIAFETKYPYYVTCNDSYILSENTDNDYYSFWLYGDYFQQIANLYENEYDRQNGNVAFNTNTRVLNSYNDNKNSYYTKNLSNLNFASNFLINSHKVLKACRNWWSFHIPESIIIFPGLSEMFGDPYRTYENIFFDSRSYSEQFRYRNFVYNFSVEIPLASNEYDILRLDKTKDFNEILDAYNTADIDFYHYKYNDYNYITVFKDNDTFSEIHPDIKTYFKEMTNWWLSGDHVIYRPGLVTEDVWKYDLSGNTDYGMVFPPVRQNHCDIFDNNFAAQFVVFAKTTDICTKSNLKCINPNGFVTTSGCTAGNPYCNCPAQNRKPTEAEPSYLEIYKLEQEIKECSLISEHLGKDWLGCVWSNPDSTFSCNCPEIGDKFMDYLEYNRTYATFWNTPAKTPLLRNAQINLLFSTKLSIKVQANPSLKIGDIIYILQPNTVPNGENPYKRFTGKYLVTSINYIFNGNAVDYYELTLNRDSSFLNPNEGSEPIVIQ
jgi:hypothetical protein